MLRFAPSPTGRLHVGNARVAILNYLFAKKNKLKFILRIDDTDKNRSKESFIKLIQEDLKWLGIHYDSTFNQSNRMKKYYEVCEILKKKGKLYPCYETPEELELKRKIQLKTGKPPIYDRSSLKLSKKDISEYDRLGRKPHWRLLLDDDPIHWVDLIHKDINFEKLSISDPVLVRSDDTPLFTITSVVDDIDFNISHILRGDDHLTNTAAQIKLFKYLGGNIPNFGHLPLMKSFSGAEMSKRSNTFSLKEIREKKINPDALNTVLSLLGTKFSTDEILSIDELIDKLDLENFSSAPIKFNYEDLYRLNSKFIKELSYTKIKKIVKYDFSNSFWEAIKSNIENIDDIDVWLDIIYNENFSNIKSIKDKKLLEVAQFSLPDEIDHNSWKKWTDLIKDKSGIKGKNLFMPLRIALTGLENGPEMKLVLPLMKREEIIRRLNK